jgi:hypothetical protein
MFLQRAILLSVVGAAFITSARADQPRCAPIMHGRALQVGSGGRDERCLYHRSLVRIPCKKMTPTQCKAEARASAQTSSDGIVHIVQDARFYEAELIFKIGPRRTASAEEPVPPRTLTYASGDDSIPE